MITASIMGVLALVALLALWRIARGPGSPVRALEDVEGHTIPVDLAAFRNLVDPGEESFLRANLPRRQWRRIQRSRNLAAMEYVKSTAHNAAVLLRLGEVARRSEDPAVARAAQNLVNVALRARWYALLALIQLTLRFLVPGLPFSLASAIQQYERLRESLTGLGKLQSPALVARISTAL